MPTISREELAVEYVRRAMQQPGVRPPRSEGEGRSAMQLAGTMAIEERAFKSRDAFRHAYDRAEAKGLVPEYMNPKTRPAHSFVDRSAPAFTVAQPPEAASKSIEQIIAERNAAFHRKKSGDTFRKAIDVTLHEPGPFGLCFFGDPHLDNDGTNWPLLQAHINAVRETPGMLACSVGDYRDNWVGRLTSIYAHGGAKVDEGVALLEWFCGQIPWLALTRGNHDCHDMETEALTKRGWLKFDDIRDDDLVWSLTPQGVGEWSPINLRIDKISTDPMVSIERSAFSMCVTPNHRVLHRQRIKSGNVNYGPLQYTRAADLRGQFSIPVSAPSGKPEYSERTDAEIALVGWFLTDGGASYRDGSLYGVSFYQSKPAPALEAALAGAGFTPKMSVRERNITSICGVMLKKPPLPQREYKLPLDQARQFMTYAEAKGRVPSWVSELSDRQFDVFLDAVIAGDGSWATNGYGTAAVVHGTKAFLESLQIACVQHGWSAGLVVVRGKDYRLNVCRRREWQAHKKVVVKTVAPVGRVWCLSVPHTNFMVRRNGKAHFSGNSWGSVHGDVMHLIKKLQNLPGPYGQDDMRLCIRSPNGAEMTLRMRHRFPGNSMYSPGHGAAKEALLGARDHVLAAGDIHSADLRTIWHEAEQRLCIGLQVGAYKQIDDYAVEKGFRPVNWTPNMAVVVDPDRADDPRRFITAFWDLEEACEYLAYKRERYAQGRASD